MLFRSSLFLVSLLAVDAMKSDSAAGRSLLSKARRLDGERDITFVAQYDIVYTGCSSMMQLADEANGGGEEMPIYKQQMVKFSLCPSSNECGNCKGGADYVISMMEFVDAYTEFKMNALEQACENIRENCYCNNQYQDEDACENQCYTDAEMTECIQYEGDEEYDVQEFLECAEMPNQNGNGNGDYVYNGDWENYYGPYYVGPYCADDGFSINIGVFYDMGCAYAADNDVFGQKNYGAELPFATESMVEGDCISCMQVDEDNNNNNNNNGNNNNNNNGNGYELNELCEMVYEESVKCEKNLNINWQDNSGCDYIGDILPKLEAATAGKRASSGGAAVAFAWIFAVTTLLAGSYAFFLYRKLDRNRVDLSSSDGALA